MPKHILQSLVSSGYPVLDRLLPAGGFERGTLIEWLNAVRGTGGARLALEVACRAAETGGSIVVLDRKRWFYPVAALELGIDLQRLVVVLAQNAKDEVWAIDQALRCSGVAAVWAFLEQLDWRTFRRLQLAAESSDALGLLVRPPKAVGQPSWSHLRLLIEPCMTTPTNAPPNEKNPNEKNPDNRPNDGPTNDVQRLRVRLLRYKSPYKFGTNHQESLLDDLHASRVASVIANDSVIVELGGPNS